MFRKGTLCIANKNLSTFMRYLTSTEVSTALRPFYFSVHPDLFGQHPKERATNESSLQQLSSILQSLQGDKLFAPITLPFYVKNRNNQNESAKLIKIFLKDRDLGTVIVHILKACDLPISHIEHYIKPAAMNQNMFHTENIQQNGDEWISVRYKNEFDFTKLNRNHPLYATFELRQQMKDTKHNLRTWLETNFEDALEKFKKGSALREEIQRLKVEIINQSKLKDIKWDCGWNSQHFRGCILSLKSLMDQHPQHMKQLENQILVFSYFTGISLDGHIMLFSGEVRHNWLDFIKNIGKHKAALRRVPYYEKSLSHILRNIKVGKRKFMPDMKVEEYELNLRQLTTSVSDYFGRNRYPKSWPHTLDNFEIVVESEAGPMMVSPTGQFIVPSSIPGQNLISFITTNLEEADKLSGIYRSHKGQEKELQQQCIDQLQLAALLKDDNITPEYMILFCKKILESQEQLKRFTKDLRINVSTYYSVLSDGAVCIPWNFVL
ncbi:T-cell activation inhibitor, mitochondrial [Euwallacea fornicatus]|uniref:T-cell activation inhibitor, mitochondrial n=1 Tax=Euwallacea fornicatus TaxID=995702 RepID=UPI0033905585